MEPVVVLALGGVGNQLFQFAAGRLLSESTGRRLTVCCRMFDVPAYRRAYLATRRLIRLARSKTADERFTIRSHARVPEILRLQDRAPECDRSLERRADLRRRRLRRVMKGEPLAGMTVIREVEDLLECCKQREAPSPDRPVLVAGFLQSDRVVAPQIDAIRSMIDLPRASRYVRRWTSDPAAVAGQLIAVHVRRGDYTKKKNAASFTLVPASWYREAAERIMARQEGLHFLVVSDDPAWCREHLRLPGKTVVASADHPASPLEDLALLASCRHHIIANSTFSWWGARLAQPGGMVVAPSRWFLDRETPRDLFPDSWTLLENPPSRA